MNSGALFCIYTEARTRVLTEMSEIRLHKNEVGRYAYNDANTLLTQIKRVLDRQLYEDSVDGMKGLASDVRNVLNEYKLTIHIKKRDVFAASRAAAECASTDNITVKLDITNNSDAQDKADRQNVFCLAAIGVKDGIAEGTTNIVGRNTTNPILRTTDNSDFKSVDQFHIHQLFNAIKEGAERPESTNIWRYFVNIAGKFFDSIETVMTNVERMAEMSTKSLG